MKRVLVTGAEGFIGMHLLPLLIEKGYEVHAVSFPNARPQADKVSWHQADLMNERDIEKLLADLKPTHI